MIRTLGAFGLLAVAWTMPLQDAQAQEGVIGGAIFGGVTGGLIGGAVGGRKGVAAGAAIGAVTGAAIGASAERRNGYYWYEGRCWQRYPSGEYAQVSRRYCQ
jgi:uncharacterized protein YcfJ